MFIILLSYIFIIITFIFEIIVSFPRLLNNLFFIFPFLCIFVVNINYLVQFVASCFNFLVPDINCLFEYFKAVLFGTEANAAYDTSIYFAHFVWIKHESQLQIPMVNAQQSILQLTRIRCYYSAIFYDEQKLLLSFSLSSLQPISPRNLSE